MNDVGNGLTFDVVESAQFLQLWIQVTGVPHVTLVAIQPDTEAISAQTFARGQGAALSKWIIQHQDNGRGIYFQANETRPDCNKKPGKADMVAALCRFGDVDPDDAHHPLADERDRLRRLAEALADDPLFPPTVIIHSGNGIQPIYAVEREVLSPEVTARAEAETRALEAALGGGGTHNIDRLLRLPATLNFPNKAKRARGRGVTRARLIFAGSSLYRPEQVVELAAHTAARLDGNGLVRTTPRANDADGPAQSDPADVVALIEAMRTAGADKVVLESDLPPELWARFSKATAARRTLSDRWAGLVDDLAEAGLDPTRSGADMSLAAMVKAAGFTHLEAGIILCSYPHGKTNKQDWASETLRLRHVARCVLRSHEPATQRRPRATAGTNSEADQAEVEAEASTDGALKGDVLPPELHGCPLTEDGVAMAFAIERGEQLRFCHGPNRWHQWDGTRWKPEPTKLAYCWVRELARRMARNTASARLRATLGKASFAAGVERMAQSDRTFAITPDRFDRDPWLLGTPDGTVDLRTGELRAARRADFISKQTLITPAEPGMPHPMWTRFLKDFTNDDREYRRFIQQVFGYCLTGDVREECLFFFFGPGQTGKGTLLRTVANVMGDYVTASDMETFTVSKFSRHPTELAKLAGARMVTATETERGRTWAWSRIKYLTGNERPVSAHFMRKDDFEHWPTYKLVFAGNHKPRLPSTDEEARRRVNVLPATHKVEKPDNTLKDGLITEYPAILRSMIDGCLDWQANGLLRPSVVLAASQAYLEEQDLFAQWVDAECTTGLTDAATHKALFASWSAFAIANGVHPGSGIDFTERMIRAGFKQVKHTPGDNARRGFLGIALSGFQTSPPPWASQFHDSE